MNGNYTYVFVHVSSEPHSRYSLNGDAIMHFLSMLSWQLNRRYAYSHIEVCIFPIDVCLVIDIHSSVCINQVCGCKCSGATAPEHLQLQTWLRIVWIFSGCSSRIYGNTHAYIVIPLMLLMTWCRMTKGSWFTLLGLNCWLHGSCWRCWIRSHADGVLSL